MAYTQTDIDNLERAMAKGVMEVEYSGQRVRFQSLNEMRAQRDAMKAEMAGSASRPRFADTIYDRT